MDVDSLYTNIDIPAGLRAVQKTFNKYPDDLRPDRELLQLLEINLTRNDFEFNGEYFLQIKGTAMGKKFAPAYANIFMANWEEEVLALCSIKPFHYLRYLDDVWGVWNNSMDEFEKFVETLNNHDPSIKIKHVFDKRTIDFLDTTVYIGPSYELNQTLDIKVYFKNTDTHALLFKNSFHPRHTFKGIVKSQLLRFHRICTQEEEFRVAVNTLFKALRNRGYSRTFLRHCLHTFQTQKPRDTKDMIPLVTNFSTVSTGLNRTFKNNYKSFMEDTGVLQNHQIISAYRRNKSIMDLLVCAQLKPIRQTRARPAPPYFSQLKYIRCKSNRMIFEIPQGFSPITSNCVYVIFCSICKIQYVGETRNSIRTRMWQHKYNILNKKETGTPLVRHFLLHGWPAVRVSGLQHNASWTNMDRKKEERRWIHSLNTIEPSGLNKKYN